MAEQAEIGHDGRMGARGAGPVMWLVAFVGFACEGASSATEPPALICWRDADCPMGLLCRSDDVSEREAPIVVNPCRGRTSCSGDSACATGQICVGKVLDPTSSLYAICTGPVCANDCRLEACPEPLVCTESGACEARACEAPRSSCPEHYRCDPDAAFTDVRGYPVETKIPDSEALRVQAGFGCVLARCDESDGYVCPDGWVCDPARATNASGCVALPCSEIGHCDDDEQSICEPLDDSPRAISFDPHGCVTRNCREGLECAAGYDCAAGVSGAGWACVPTSTPGAVQGSCIAPE
jgi:hypothetical protein